MTRHTPTPALLLPRWLPRLAVLVAGLAIWFWTQSLIGEKVPAPGAHGIGDAVHETTARANAWLNEHASAANALLIASSLGIDALGLFILGSTLFGKSVRPFLGLVILFGLRQICQALTSLPPPEVTIVLLLRAHYTIDVFAGALAALWVGSISPRLAAPVDARLNRWSKPMNLSTRRNTNHPGNRR